MSLGVLMSLGVDGCGGGMLGSCILEYWCDVVRHWIVGLLDCWIWIVGLLEYWSIASLAHWLVGLLGVVLGRRTCHYVHLHTSSCNTVHNVREDIHMSQKKALRSSCKH
jgi:hypothetical protein